MGLETGNTINDLNESWPLGTDPKSQGDDHIRLCKRVFKNDVLSTTNGGTISGDVDFAGDVNFAGNVTGLAQTANPSLIINGGFDVWQRGTSFTGLSSQYCADRFYFAGAKDVVREDEVPAGTTFTYSAKVTSTNAASIRTTIELPFTGHRRPFSNNSVWTLSFYILNNGATANTRMQVLFADDSANNNSVTVHTDNSQTAVGGTWVKLSTTFTVTATPAPTNKCLLVEVGLNVAGSCNITGVKLEQGSVATPWFYEDYGTTLAKCQRYYYRYDGIALGFMFNDNVAVRQTNVYYPQTMRIAPTIADILATAGTATLSDRSHASARFNIANLGVDSAAGINSFTADAEL
jgi:hypothetical protein